MNANNPRIVVHIGATGSGKSAKMSEELERDQHERFFAWDVKGEWARKLRIPLTSDWNVAARCLEALKKGAKLRVAFKPNILDQARTEKQFRRACHHLHQARDMAFLLEEASIVLKPGGGNEQLWLTLVNLHARDAGIALYIITQRPTLMDKSSLSNVTMLRAFKLGYGPDMDTCAAALRVPVAAVEAVKKLEFIERDPELGTVRPGRLEFHGDQVRSVYAPRAPCSVDYAPSSSTAASSSAKPPARKARRRK